MGNRCKKKETLSNGALLMVPKGASFYCIQHNEFFRQQEAFETHISGPSHLRHMSRCEKCHIPLQSKREVDQHKKGRGSHTFPFSTRWIEWSAYWVEVWRKKGFDEVVDAWSAGQLGILYECNTEEVVAGEKLSLSGDEGGTSSSLVGEPSRVKLVRVLLREMEGVDISNVVPEPGYIAKRPK